MPQSCPNLKQETDFHILKLYNNWLMVTGLGEGSINSQILSVLCISVQSDSSRAKDSSLKIYRVSWLLKAPLGAMGVGLEMVKWSLSKYRAQTLWLLTSVVSIVTVILWPFDMLIILINSLKIKYLLLLD